MGLRMLKSKSAQRSFLDTDHLADFLLPPDSFYRRFRELVWPLIQDKDFEPYTASTTVDPQSHPRYLRWR